MKKAFIFFIFLVFAPSIVAQQDFSPDEIARWEQQANSVTITRDKWGVPHIKGKTDADAVFGLLYAQSEDDFPRVERNYYWAIGRLAEVEGEKAIYSDLRARLYMTTDEAKAAYRSAPEWLKKLCDAYADGINYYLYKHPEVKPKLLTRFEPWFPMFFSEGSIGGDIESVSARRIKEFYKNDRSLALNEFGNGLEYRDLYDEPRGSNGFAISGKHTRSGNAMLLINPHTSFYFRGEVHVKSDEGLNAYGAVTWGQFFVYQGFNENTGWMHMSTRVDFMDEFVEDVRRVNGKLKYKYGDEMRDVKVSEVTLKYKDDGKLKEKTFPMYHTHHGPVTHKLGGKWVSTKLNWDPVNALIQSFTRTKLKNHKEFRKMMDIRRNSSNNTVFADSSGNIAYYHGNFIPRRDPKFDFSKPVDGSDPATDWKGLHTVDEVITITNPKNGWIQNCNSTPFTAALEYSPKREDYPTYMAPDLENYRGVHAVKVLKNAKDLTLDKLIALAYDPYLPAFEKLVPGLVEAYDSSGKKDPKLKGPIDVLRKWDFKTSEKSVAMSLAHFYGLRYNREGKNPGRLRGIERFDYFGTGSPYRERLAIFARAVDQLEKDFGTWSTPWGEINRFQRLSGEINAGFDDQKPSIPIGLASGRWGALASFGARARPNTKRIYGSSGNSFVAVVEFGKKVKAKSILAGGQSGHPGSKHFYDQAQMYADAKFKDVLFYQEDIDRNTERKYRPGERGK
ncbi:MAG: acylase [Pyrinomonadaceae bacterium]|nr:acylase [Pyrinomonadaceae bacterium]